MEGDDEQLDAQIQAQVEEWSTNSSECFHISLASHPTTTFPPDFTYPIFGEEEAIFGYQDLSIDLTFASHDLAPQLTIRHGEKFKAQGEVRPTDLKEALSDFLPPAAFERGKRGSDPATFTPPGERVQSYARDGSKFEIWCATLANPQARKILVNMQILVPLFIEGGTTLQLDDERTRQRWKLFLLYQVNDEAVSAPPYSFIGFGTSYRVFTLPDRHNPVQTDLQSFSQPLDSFLPPPESETMNTTKTISLTTPLDLPSRERLSQFLILPPFQGNGHGQYLYNTMYTYLTAPPNVREFTVEDPNEAFDALRDDCDLRYLRASNRDFAALRINTTISAADLASSRPIPTSLIIPADIRAHIQHQTKIEPRQFARLVEMHTLSSIPPLHRSRNRITRKEKSSNEHDRAYYLWRLYAKQRLYIHNRDQLVQVERAERVEKLEAALDGVVEEYGARLEKVAKGGVEGSGVGDGSGNGDVEEGTTAPKVRKRKVVVDVSDEDEDEDEGEGDAVLANGRKKARVL